jgi:hypothetical protein
MPRSTIANRSGKLYDKSLELLDANVTNLSATTTTVGVAFDLTKYLNYNLLVHTPGYTGYVAGTAAWTVKAQASLTQVGTYVDIDAGAVEVAGTAGYTNIPLNRSAIAAYLPEAQYIRLVITKVGAAGNLVAGAFLTDVAC